MSGYLGNLEYSTKALFFGTMYRLATLQDLAMIKRQENFIYKSP